MGNNADILYKGSIKIYELLTNIKEKKEEVNLAIKMFRQNPPSQVK